jgi:hypothetical protein
VGEGGGGEGRTPLILLIVVVHVHRYRLIDHVFEYYCIAGSGMSGYGSGSMSIHQNPFMSFLKELGNADPSISEHIEEDAVFQELVRIFLTVNLEEDKTAVTHKHNHNSAIMKHEWVETLCR